MKDKRVLIFGVGPSADVARQIFEEFTSYDVLGFTVDRAYLPNSRHNGLPVLPFEDLHDSPAARDCEIFVSVGYGNMNEVRRAKCSQVKEHGFKLASLIHPKANLPSDFVYGENCFIMNDVHIHPCVSIGDDNFVWSGTTLCHHVSVGNDCWFTSGAMIAGNTRIGSGCFFGINSTVTNGLEIGDKCFVGAGALVAKSMKDKEVVVREADHPHRLNSDQFLRLIGNRF